MGGIESQAQSELPIGNELNRESYDEIPNVHFNNHIKYEELTYNESKELEKPEAPVSPSELFDIAVCHPEFCKSVTDMIRHAIRTASIQEKKRQKNYRNNFSSSNKMEYNLLKLFKRFSLQNRLCHFFKENNFSTKKSAEIGFQDILNFFKYNWYLKYKNAIDSLQKSILSLTHQPNTNSNDEVKLRQIICQIIGNESYEALVPKRRFDIEEISNDLKKLVNRISNPITFCCMQFPSTTKPIKRISIYGKVLRHGICSNGTFLFILTEENKLFVYRIYKGIIDKLVKQKNLKQSWKFTEETFLFCSQKLVFIKNDDTTFQSSISSIINNNSVSFYKSDKPEFEHLISACSNGASYSIINDSKTIQTFSAENESLVSRCQTKYASNLDKSKILLSNGYYFGLLKRSGKIKMLPLIASDNVLIKQEDNFPSENESSIEAATIDILTNSYFSASYSESESIVYCYPYIGPTDLTIFGSDFFQNYNNREIDFLLLNHISSCAFSTIIPDNLTNSENAFNDLKSIIVLIEQYGGYDEIFKTLLLLLEINLRKHKCGDFAKFFLPTIVNIIKKDKYKRVAMAILINNIDLFYDKFDESLFDLLKSILNSSSDNDGYMFNEWLLSCLMKSNLLSTIEINKNLLTFLFGEHWYLQSRSDVNNAWIVDLLLIAQQTIAQNAMKLLENDPLNFSNSKLIDSLCAQANFLFENFRNFLVQIINDHQSISNRNVNYDTIIYTLISNFVAIVSPITKCSQFAIIITNENAKTIFELLSSEFIYDKNLQLFVEYFSMIYTLSIASLMRGGPVYQCENDYSWLIQGNFYNGSKEITVSDLSQTQDYLLSDENEFMSDFIKNGNENIDCLYQKIRSFRLVRNDYAIIDRIILAAVLHQTNTFNLFNSVKQQEAVCPEILSIVNFVKKIRIKYSHALQNEVTVGIKGIKQSDKYIANLRILIILEPVLTDFLEKAGTERTKYFQKMEQFILNNNPHLFHHVLQAIPKRIENIILSIDRLNSLLNDAQKPILKTIIIDGISCVDSFERLGYLLSYAKLDKNDLSILEIFCITCTDMVCKYKHLSILEILYTVLNTCKTLTEKAIKTMNELSRYVCKKVFVLDSFFMTVAGLAGSTCTVPKNFKSLPEIGKAYILQTIYSQRDVSTLPINEIQDFIIENNGSTEKYILNEVWVRMIFTLLSNCLYDNNETVFDCLEMIFQMASDLIDDRCLVFPTLPAIIYGFRHIINLGNDISDIAFNLMITVTTQSKIGEIFLLFAIVAADISDFSKFYEIRNHQGRWLKCPNNYCLPLPLYPYSERHDFDFDINESIQEEELNIDKSLDFDWIIEYWEFCMRDHGSILCRFFLQALTRYVSNLGIKFPEEYSVFLANTAIPYVDFYNISYKQTLLYENIATNFKYINPILFETKNGFDQIKQLNNTHLFVYNVMKFGRFKIYSYIKGKSYFVIHNHDKIFINVQTGVINNTKERINIDDGQLFLNIDDNDFVITVCNRNFQCEENTYIEYIIESIDKSAFQLDKRIDFNNFKVCYSDNANNMDINYINDIFIQDKNEMTDFASNLKEVVPINVKCVDANILEREGINIFYNPLAESIIFNRKKKFIASPSYFINLCKTNEVMICNQLKSVVLAHTVIKNHDSLDWKTIFSFVKSAVITLCSFNKEKFFKGEFPFSLNDGFFHNFSLNFLQSSNVQTFFIAMKTLLKSKSFMDNLGNQLVLMAHDRFYHSLIHKKELVLIKKEQLCYYEPNENDYIVDFPDGTKGILEIDQFGNWMINTPMVFLLLLWIFIDNCSTSEQRINAKLALIDCWIIKSPLIYIFMPEFLSYLQRRLFFSPEDFNPTYISHLSSLAAQNQDNEQIINFYEFEKNCYKLRQVQQQISSKSINLNEMERIDFDINKKKMNPREMIEIIQLMKKYDSVEHFPVWHFLPIWRTISSFSLIKYSNFDMLIQQKKPSSLINLFNEPLLFTIMIDDINNNNNISFELFDQGLKKGKKLISEDQSIAFKAHFVIQPHQRMFLTLSSKGERLIKIQTYKVINEEEVTYENFENDIKNFAINWEDNDTEEFLNLNFNCNLFLWLILDTLNMTELIKKHGLHTVQCKAACLFLINSISIDFSSKSSSNQLSLNENEMIRVGKENSKLLSYQTRMNEFEFQNSAPKPSLLSIGLELFSNKQIGYIMLDSDSAFKFSNGESENVNDSMIYQISKHMKRENIKRFQSLIWAIKFKGADSIDISGVTKQTISMSIQSFLSPKTGICIISPNFTENASNDEHESDIQVIPYPSRSSKSINDVLYSFGVILGSIIRTGNHQEIPFPSFVWNFLAGKTITKNCIYENDSRLKDEIIGLKNGSITDHLWVYRDWNNAIKQINGCPLNKFVPQDLAEVYETLVIDLRIESIKKFLVEIRRGLWDNQNIQSPQFLSGGLLSFLSQGKKSLNMDEIIKRIIFNNANEQLKNNFLSIVKEYDEQMMKNFLMFVTASQKPPNFVISPDFCITVEFVGNSDKLPTAQTCFKLLRVPSYQTIEIMRNKLNYAIQNCFELENS